MRSRFRVVALLAMLSAVAFMRVQSGDRWPVFSHTPAAVVAPSHTELGPVPVTAVRAAFATHRLPAPAPIPFDLLALGLVIGATSASGRKDRGQMIIDSVLHVSRKDGDGKPITRAIPAGILLDDVDDDIKLTDDEIDEFTARRVIRYATPDEVERAEQTKANREAAKVTQAGEANLAGVNAKADAERQAIIADFDRQKNEALAKHDEQVTKDRTEAEQRTAEQVKDRTAARTTRTTSTAGAQSAARTSAAEARAQAAGGTHSPTGASSDPGAEGKK